jgi:hypothetical protein
MWLDIQFYANLNANNFTVHHGPLFRNSLCTIYMAMYPNMVAHYHSTHIWIPTNFKHKVWQWLFFVSNQTESFKTVQDFGKDTGHITLCATRQKYMSKRKKPGTNLFTPIITQIQPCSSLQCQHRSQGARSVDALTRTCHFRVIFVFNTLAILL